jgi:alpha-ketoglutarate-dependent taurine dioxygenase
MKVTFDTKENPLYGDYSRGYFRGTFYWHVDGTYDEVPPLASILTPRVLSPTGGQTEFASTYAAYEQLSQEDKTLIEELKVLHTIEAAHRLYDPNPDAETLKLWNSYPTRVRSLVWNHKSGRKSLGVGANCSQIIGMDKALSGALIDRLMKWTVQPQFVYQHHWEPGDMLIWDNTGTMHRVLAFDVKCGRRLHRVTLEGEEFRAESA